MDIACDEKNNNSSTSFGPFHLDLLESLYTNESLQQYGHKDSIDDDSLDKDSDDLWPLIRSFLSDRPSLLQHQRMAANCRGVAQQAHKLLDNAKPASADRPSPSNRHILNSAQRPSPVWHQSPATPKVTSHRSFGLVASLLHRRSQTAQTNYQTVVKPYQELQKTVEDYCSHLQSILATGQEQAQNEQKILVEQLLTAGIEQTNQNSDQSFLAATACKLHLWKLLWTDLRRALEK